MHKGFSNRTVLQGLRPRKVFIYAQTLWWSNSTAYFYPTKNFSNFYAPRLILIVIRFTVDAFLSILKPAALNQEAPRLVTLSATLIFNTNLANSLHRDMSNSIYFLLGLQPNAGYGLLIHEVSRSHTTTQVSRNPLDEWSGRRRDLYLTTHDNQQIQTSVPPMGFETTNAAGERPQTYILDRAATRTGNSSDTWPRFQTYMKKNKGLKYTGCS
jgi:hypothetical protein